jgi:hypothetical protein
MKAQIKRNIANNSKTPQKSKNKNFDYNKPVGKCIFVIHYQVGIVMIVGTIIVKTISIRIKKKINACKFKKQFYKL